jgi:general secretion pathway protein H
MLLVVKAKMPTLISGNRNGFTLLEVLLVLIIGSLLMGVVASAITDGPILRKASREVVASLRHARVQAIMQQQAAVWKMNISQNSFWVSAKNNTAEKHSLPDKIKAKVNTNSAEIDSPEQAGIRFYPDGSSSGGSVELSYDKQQFKVNVEWVTGRVSIQ